MAWLGWPLASCRSRCVTSLGGAFHVQSGDDGRGPVPRATTTTWRQAGTQTLSRARAHTNTQTPVGRVGPWTCGVVPITMCVMVARPTPPARHLGLAPSDDGVSFLSLLSY